MDPDYPLYLMGAYRIFLYTYQLLEKVVPYLVVDLNGWRIFDLWFNLSCQENQRRNKINSYSAYKFFSIIRISHILVLLSVPSSLHNNLLLSDPHLSILVFITFNLSNRIFHVGPHILQFFMSSRFKDLIMRDRQILQHLPKSLNFIQLQIFITNRCKSGLTKILLSSLSDHEVFGAGFNCTIVHFVALGNVFL